MSRIVRLIGSMCVAMLLAWSIGPRVATNTARADDCLAQPNSSAPQGSHWYYHIDQATQRKCWYVRALDQQAQQPAAQPTSPVTSSTPVPLEKNATATSEATSISPIPVEKPKPATSRVRPTIPIPLEKPASASAGAPMPATPSTAGPPPPHIKMLRVVSNGATNRLVQQDAKQEQNTTAITAAPAPEQSPSQTRDQATEPARAAIIWPDPSRSALATTPDATTPDATTATTQEATTLDHVETPRPLPEQRRQRNQSNNPQQTLGRPMPRRPLLKLMHQPTTSVQRTRLKCRSPSRCLLWPRLGLSLPVCCFGSR